MIEGPLFLVILESLGVCAGQLRRVVLDIQTLVNEAIDQDHLSRRGFDAFLPCRAVVAARLALTAEVIRRRK
jgi:hypothetical protein